MSSWQFLMLLIFLVYSIFAFTLGVRQTIIKQNAYGLTPFFFPLGIFVWADAFVFGLFWTLIATFFIIIQSFILFLISFAFFWLVRSAGETIYWFNQQFTLTPLDPPETLFLSKYFPGKSIWFIYQTFHQCLTVLSGLALVYLLKIYLFT